MFLQLLVAQLKNQDPMNPTDSTQFVSQLAQFSELEQVIGIRGDIETQMNSTSTSTGTTSGTSSTSGSSQS
jgi:flagellar basal-body rod modification protein FlgD